MSPGKRILASVSFSYLLLMMRILATGDLTYFFLGWNLLLAGIPYGLAGFLSARFAGWKNWLLIMAWLLFLPNAPYIITDFLHLKHRPPVPYWFDVLLLFSAAMNGLMLGILSLLKVERFLTGRYGNRMSAFLMFGCVFLSGLGIYLGRWLRWNSWDVFFNPGKIGGDILVSMMNPFDHLRTWSVTLLFGGFMYMIFYVFKGYVNQQSTQQ